MSLIEVKGLSKKFNSSYIIKNFNYAFEFNNHYAIQGANGSGKSTLIKMLIGYLSPSYGEINYSVNSKKIKRNEVFKYISLASPYSSVIDDFTLEENFNFFKNFKETTIDLNYKDLLSLLEWRDPYDKPFSNFSSGMQQKVNVCFALIAKTPILILDEPTSFMDSNARSWYKEKLDTFSKDRTVIIASNDTFDFDEKYKVINVENYK